MNLYTDYAQEFSKTRTAPWAGWNILSDQLKALNFKPIACLDLGCGNGRFLNFLSKITLEIESYYGIDNSDYLLKECSDAINTLGIKGGTQNLDLNSNYWDANLNPSNLKRKTFNLTVAFGLLHHITTFEARRSILEISTRLLEPSGLLIITYWRFAELERYRSKMKALGENNYEMSFGKHGATRFCHYTTKEEIQDLEQGLDLKLIEEYYADGRENNENLYKIYQKK